MATEYIYLKGKAKWVRVHAPNKWGKWSAVLYPDAESLEMIRDLQAQGIKNVVKKDDDGYYTTFSRPAQIERGGKIIGMHPVEVLYNGEPLRDTAVGNGSDVTIKVEVYEHKVPASDKKAKAARLFAIRVDNLIPFDQNRDFEGDDAKVVEGLAEQPPQKLF